ncbi:MAG: zinc metalloprotease HtpX [Candidatus Eiseniibacteriota bacterium]|jgi:heat shock protein HtpX
MNAIKTTLLLAVLTVLLVLAGQLIGGRQGAVVALVLAAIMNLGAYWFSDRIVLARYHGQEVDASSAPRLHGIVQRLAERAGLPMPRVFLIPSDTPNAFATGRDPAHAAVAATRGLVDQLEDAEIEGVMAHELSHVRHRDILISSMAATLAGAIMILASMARFAAIFGGGGSDRRNGGGLIGLIAMSILAPIAAMLVQMAISRSREYAADAGAAELTRNPLGLASALRKLEAMAARRPLAAGPETAHLFIVNPLRGKSLASLFSTHPPIEQRIERLEALARGR